MNSLTKSQLMPPGIPQLTMEQALTNIRNVCSAHVGNREQHIALDVSCSMVSAAADENVKLKAILAATEIKVKDSKCDILKRAKSVADSERAVWYVGEPEKLEIFQHGMQTIINMIEEYETDRPLFGEAIEAGTLLGSVAGR